MGAIRPAGRRDMPAVVGLHERVAGERGEPLPPGLGEHLERLFFDSPWADPELGPLAYVEDDGTISAFLGSSARRFVREDRTVRVRVSSHLLADQRARKSAAGLRLLRALLDGPQDLTVTDSANASSVALWSALGGVTAPLPGLAWVRLFEPWQFARAYLGWRRRPGLSATVGAIARPLDLATTRAWRRAFAVPGTEASTLSLDARALAGAGEAVGGAFDLRPQYEDVEFTRWLLAAVEITWGAGRVHGGLVERAGRPLGAFLYGLKEGRVAEALLVLSAPRDSGTVLDALYGDARARGLAAVQGRLDGPVAGAVLDRPCVLHRSGATVLVHSRDRELLGAVLAGRALLSRLDADWWMYGAWWDLTVGSSA